MIEVTVNGKPVQVKNEHQSLLSFLRDTLRLTSVKEGCAEGACGACTVLVDGQKTRACSYKLGRLAGKSVITMEGLSQREKNVYVHAFAEAGAVQCGFCTPGMVIAAKSLLDAKLTPSREDIKEALKGNICRCTGYVNIEEAVLTAARFFRDNLPVPLREMGMQPETHVLLPDTEEKVLGTGEFCDDVAVSGMVYAKALYSAFPRARINRIDVSGARSHPACLCVLTAKDVPHNRRGPLDLDRAELVAEGEETRCTGDVLALVAATSPEALDQLLALVKVECTELPPVVYPADALRGDSPLLHPGGNVLLRERLQRGDVDAAIKASRYVITRKYAIPFAEQASLESECAVAMPMGDDGVFLYTGSRSVYDDREEVARMLRLPLEKVHVQARLAGSGFSGKADTGVQYHAALMAWSVKKPVKMKAPRREIVRHHTGCHAVEMELTTACDENGALTAVKALLIADAGAYAAPYGADGPELRQACMHAAGPYSCPNVDILGMAVRTNNVPPGIFKDSGAPQICFASETNINLLAETAGVCSWEFRHRNALRPGDMLPDGRTAGPDCAVTQCLEAIREAFDASPYAGIACAFKDNARGAGSGEAGRCLLSIEKGRAHIRVAGACANQSVSTMCARMICRVTGLDPGLLVYEPADTVRTPDVPSPACSAQLTGEAARRAAEKLNVELRAGKTLAALEGREFYGECPDAFLAYPGNGEAEFACCSAAAQIVLLDEEGKVIQVAAAYDVGIPVDSRSVESRIAGGIVMGLSHALTGNRPPAGAASGAGGELPGVWRSSQTPDIAIRLIQAGPEALPVPSAIKSLEELCLTPTAPACAHAYYRLDGTFRQQLPLRDTYYSKEKHS